jgi:predicted transcriptional regulator
VIDSILLSIKPEYADKIISGEKIFEYRRKLPIINVKYIALYSTYPEKKILAIVDVIDQISEDPLKLWKITHKGGAITKFTFDKYFNGLFIAHAFKLGKVKKFNRPLTLNTINKTLIYPPQSFRYLSEIEVKILLSY